MTKNIIAGGCSFTFGHELSDDQNGQVPSKKTWSALLSNQINADYICTAHPGSGNSGIARRVFNKVSRTNDVSGVVVMWSFLSRYDWAMPRHKELEDTRWASISPWDTDTGAEEAFRKLAGSQTQREQWKIRKEKFQETGVKDFAESIYKYAANQYHETYLSWKSITWLQNILVRKKIPFMFTLADNTLFYNKFQPHSEIDPFLQALHSEIDFGKWYFFGDRMMGFNQWASLNGYDRGTTHPLDQAHEDAVKLMTQTFNSLITN